MLKRENRLDSFMLDDASFTGRAALSKLREFGEPRNAVSYAANVLDTFAKKEVIHVCSSAATGANNGRYAADVIKDAQTQLGEIVTFNSKALTHTQSSAQAVEIAADKTGQASRGELKYVPTGFSDLDRMLGGGMEAPDFSIIAGRPGSGKTGFMVTVAMHASGRGHNVAFFSEEMANEQVVRRMIAQESEIPYDRQKSGRLTEDEWPIFEEAKKAVSSLPITLNDLPAITISQIRQELRRMKHVDLVIVDYLQLCGVDGKFFLKRAGSQQYFKGDETVMQRI